MRNQKFFNLFIKNGHNIVLILASLLFLGALFYGAFFADSEKAKAGSGENMSGWAWGDNIGWISFNCTDTSSCATVDYGVDIAINGDLSGYAWSDNIGWITFNESDLSGCPSGACKAKLSGNNLQGWARSLSYADGWDGWISLNGSNYGVTLNNDNEFTGFVWDASNINSEAVGLGWIDFNALFGGVVVSVVSGDAPSVNLSANPISISSGGNSTLSWTSLSATECEASIGWSGSKPLSGSEIMGPLTIDTVYKLTCSNAVSSANDMVTVFVAVPTECSDGIDNDGDGQTDFPEDTSCISDAGNDESIPVCGNIVCESGENSSNCSTDCGAVQFDEF